MKIPRLLPSILPIFAFTFLLMSTGAQEKATAKDAHLGTWKLISTKYGDVKEFTKRGEDSLRIKYITTTHFTWLEVESASKKVVASAGGKYTMSGTTYTETIDYAGEGMESYLGKPQKFTVRVEGDKLYQSGELSDGLKIEEVWERLK
jgi:hypothetical protein